MANEEEVTKDFIKPRSCTVGIIWCASNIFGKLLGIKEFAICLVVFSVLFTGLFGTGMIFFEFETNTVKLFTPRDSEALTDQTQVTELFPIDYDHFVADRVYDLDQRQVSTVIYSKDLGNMLRKEQIEEVLVLNEAVLSLTIEVERNNYSYNTLCARYNSACISNPIIEYLPSIVNDNIIRIPYPNIIDESNTTENVESFLGGVRVTNDSATYVDFLMISYYLIGGNADKLSSLWEEAVRGYFAEPQFTYIDVAVFVSNGLDQAQADMLAETIPYYVGSLIIVLAFTVISSLTSEEKIYTQPWLPLFAIMTIFLAIISGLGLVCVCGVPFNPATALVPLLILAIGLDDMFILISTWRCSHDDDFTKICVTTVKFAGATITITTLTDILALASCTGSPLPVVRDFCLFALVILLFLFIYQFTFFAPLMTIIGHWQSNKNNDGKFCCVLGAHFGVDFFMDKYIKIFRNWRFYVMIGVVYIAYITASAIGIAHVTIGPEVQSIASDNSQVNTYLRLTSGHEALYGPSVSVIFTEELSYWEQDVYQMVNTMISNLESTDYVKSCDYTECWLLEYGKYLTYLKRNVTNKETFMRHLKEEFLQLPQYSKFALDIKFKDNNITSSRCVVVTENVGTTKAKGDMMLTLRDVTKTSLKKIDMDSGVFLFAPGFIFYEQYVIIVGQTLLTSVIASGWILLVSLVFIPKPVSSAFVFLSVESTIIGITGFMIFWDVNFDPFSIIYLIISFGFSVNCSFHIAYGFNVLLRDEDSRDEDSLHSLGIALGVFGYPSVQSAISSVLGISVLLFSPGYLYQSFGKVIMLAMTFGLLHGLVFFPPLLLLFNKISNKSKEDEKCDVGKESPTQPTARSNILCHYLYPKKSKEDCGRKKISISMTTTTHIERLGSEEISYSKDNSKRYSFKITKNKRYRFSLEGEGYYQKHIENDTLTTYI